jgi:UDP-glucuronate 4-epimerase
MRYLITGSAGFIGYHLSLKLLKKGFVVFGIDSLNNYYSNKLKLLRLKNLKRFKNFYFKKINLCNFSQTKKFLIKLNVDVVFHLAGQPGVLYSYKNPKSYKENNIIATNNLIKIVNRTNIKRFIFSSSSSVYGDQIKFPIAENAKLNPKNYYAVTKKICEQKIKSSLKIPYIIFRIFTVYGALGRPDMFFSIFLRNVYSGLKNKLFNFGNYFRDFTYIDDVTEVFYLSSFKKIKNITLNLCSSNPVKMIEVVNILKKRINKKFDILYLQKRKGEMLKTYGSNKKIRIIFKKKKYKKLYSGINIVVKKFTKLEKKISLA